jgi:hypothetical protein
VSKVTAGRAPKFQFFFTSSSFFSGWEKRVKKRQTQTIEVKNFFMSFGFD